MREIPFNHHPVEDIEPEIEFTEAYRQADESHLRVLGELFREILSWLTAPQKTVAIGQRTKALALYLRPGLIEEDSLLKISKACRGGVSRAALSHALLALQEEIGAHRGCFQKAAYQREASRRSAIASHKERGNLGPACQESLIAELNASIRKHEERISEQREQALRASIAAALLLRGTEAAKLRASRAAQARWSRQIDPA